MEGSDLWDLIASAMARTARNWLDRKLPKLSTVEAKVPLNALWANHFELFTD